VHVLFLGLHSRLAPLALRERAAFAAPAGAAEYVRVRAGVAEALVVSTCNRVELYAAVEPGDAPAAAERLVAVLAERAGVSREQLRAHALALEGLEAARHLCHVAAGLDSVVVGESQVINQLRRALAAARADGSLVGGVLERLGSTALAAGRRARARLAPHGGPATVAQAAVRVLGDAGVLTGARVLVMGAGETAADVLAHLRRSGVADVAVTNRSAPAGRAVAERHGARWAPWEARACAVADADVVFTCMASAEPVVDLQHLPADPERRVEIVDLGVPRNVAPAVRDRPHVRVWDVDTLAPGGDGAPTAGLDAAEAEADRWAARFARWLAAREAAPTVARLRAGAERVRDREVARALARLDGLGEREQAVVRALAQRLVNKLLHAPLATLGADPDAPALASTARHLFGLDVPAPGDAPRAPAAPAADARTPAPLDTAA
jgi:glutamyl-tRNA reductase